MPAPLAVDREQVRMLVLSVGVREAARQMGLAAGTVLAWSDRGGWLDHVRQPLKLPESMQPTVAIGAIKPVDALQSALADNCKETKLGLSTYAKRMAKQAAESGVIEEAPLYKAVADIHGKMFPEQDGGSSINLQFFTVSQERAEEGPVIDVTPE